MFKLVKHLTKCSGALLSLPRSISALRIGPLVQHNLKTEMKVFPLAKRKPLINMFPKLYFHVSPQRNAPPPLVLLVLRPVAKIFAMLFGRFIRKRWQKLPQEERERILSKIYGKNSRIAYGLIIFTSIVGLYYVAHLEEAPLTKRKRFTLYNDEQMQSISELAFKEELEMFKKDIVPITHPIYQRIAHVANRILNANKEIEQIRSKKWAITVIDQPDVVNASVLPHGMILVFTGILQQTTNDDQLAFVLSHEMAHAILSHVTENLSKTFMVEMLLLLPIIMLWALLPDAAALITQWLSSRLADIAIHLPFSRAIEAEADEVGLQLAAKACFDIREAPVFWGKMAQIEDPEQVKWLSTHPSSESRQLKLSELLPAALTFRETCQCARLPPMSASQMYYSSRPEQPPVLTPKTA